MLKIGYFGDGPWAQEALKKFIADDSIEIKFITVRYKNRDLGLVSMANENGIPLEISKNINSDEFLDRIEVYDVDIFISMSFDQIFKKKTFNYPSLKTINCHAGKLPFYRGRNILNWALINDEKEFGITVHYVDEGIDTGDIILQKTYPITDYDDYSTLLKTAYIGCADVLYSAVKQIQEGKVRRIPQKTIDPVGMYCGKRMTGDERIDWNSTSRELFNFVRAICIPGPMATAELNGETIRINKVREIPGSRKYIGKPGQILGKTSDGFIVKTKDTVIEVIEYEFAGMIIVGDRMI